MVSEQQNKTLLIFGRVIPGVRKTRMTTSIKAKLNKSDNRTNEHLQILNKFKII